MDTNKYHPDDPDRHLRRLSAIIGISTRVQALAMKKRKSVRIETREEKNEKIMKAAKLDRTGRNIRIGVNERFVIENVSHVLGIQDDDTLNFAIDSLENTTVLCNFFEIHGSRMILFQFQSHDPPSMTSGRYDPKLKDKVDVVLFSTGNGVEIIGPCVVAYRLQNLTTIEAKSVAEDIFFTLIPEGENVIASIAQIIYLFENENILKQTTNGFPGTKNDIVSCSIDLKVNNDLFKGFLLASHQIEETSKRRDKVAEVEKEFCHWMKQVECVVVQGGQLTKDTTESGPNKELELWRNMLTKFNKAVEFTDSKPFKNYLKCLKISRSKLIEPWKQIEDTLIILLNEAKDNVRFMTSIETFWDPLYRCPPLEIADCLSQLLQAIRSVYKNSNFYYSDVRITGLLSKVVNQLIIASQKYLTNNYKNSVWEQNMNEFVKKIEECKKMKEAFRLNYTKMLNEMKEDGERTFFCSDKYLFERFDSFETRLRKICEIMEICLQYQVLDRIRIGGMEPFSEKIKSAFNAISQKPFDPLAHRVKEFDDDYQTFQEKICSVEKEMQVFVKNYVKDIELAEMRILTLARFDRLNLDCLRLDRRYLDVAEMLEVEFEELKDTYNEKRGDPPIPRNIPEVIGRIMWIRMLRQKMEVPLNALKARECVLTHKRAQPCVKFYNFLTGIFLQYELTEHKAWFIYAEKVRKQLEMPVIRKDKKTNHYEVNLDRTVIQVIKETESMLKLGLEVPETANTLAYCKEIIIEAHATAIDLIQRNNKLRRTIYPQFVPLMRIQLIKLERVFTPMISTVTWLNVNLDEYFKNISEVLTPIENFLKEVSDINDQIDRTLESIKKSILVTLPEKAVDPEELLDMNVEYRSEIERKIEMKSQAAEKAAVDLINKFVSKSKIPLYERSGKYQLPLEEINETNWRVEELKPIDVYDWLSFEKLYKSIGFATPEENEILCFKDYDGLNYDVTLLHIDCVELFAYYNHKIISALARTTRLSMELFKKRSNITGQIYSLLCSSNREEALLKAEIHLKVPSFVLVPSLSEIQKYYDGTLSNIVGTHYAVTRWGQHAKTEERKKRNPLLEEKRYDTHFFITILNHKEVSRYKMSFENGVMQLESKINSILDDLYQNYKFLWDDKRESIIEAFVMGNPLTADIRDKLLHYDKITEEIKNLSKVICVRAIRINCEKMINALVEESAAWKLILGSKLSNFYRSILSEMVQFIQVQQKVLARPLADLDDCQIAMNCLKEIRENFFRIDDSLALMEDTYAMFAAFHINISPEDTERVDGLRYMFNTMMKTADAVNKEVMRLQIPLQNELEAGVEQFTKDLKTFDEDFVQRGPMVQGIPAKEASDRVLLFETRLQELTRRNEIHANGEKLFGLPVNEYPVLQKRKKDINFLNRLYKLYLDVMRSIDNYSETQFKEIDMIKITQEIQDFVNRCRKLPRGMKDWPAFIDLKQKIDDFNDSCPLIDLMAREGMKERHWQMLENIMKFKFDIHSPIFTLGVVLSAPLLEFKDDIEDVCVGAIKEQEIETKFQSVIREWKDVDLPLAPFKNRGDLLIKAGDVQDIITKLEDSLMTMGSLASNRFNGPFKKEIMLMLQRLSSTSDILERWLQVQFLWMYLEVVFVSGDIARQLPLEAKRFSAIDKEWVRIMYKARNNPNVVDLCTGDDVVDKTLKYLLEQLEVSQKSLTGYLETKRLVFPRFFFVSDPVLLEILGQASDPRSIQPHLPSIFDGVDHVEFQEGRNDMIVGMCSDNGERVPLLSPVKCSGNVEIWIGRLLEMVQDTVRMILADIGLQMGNDKFNYKDKLESLCGQGQLICIQLLWTKDAEYALSFCKIDRKILQKTLLGFQDMLDFFLDLTVKNLTKLERVTVETLVTIHVHQKDIFDELVRLKIKSVDDFEWQKQARFYFDLNQEETIVKITDIDFVYQNEYLGVKERLVITPLTDRCYITWAQAIGMHMGGAPAGPAGTGKTETTKDMGRALGKLVVVFNCSDQMDFRGLGRIYKGLAQSGSWGCFDEFNRIELPVLSVAAQQIYIVLNAKREKKKVFIFSDGDKVKLNPEFGIFITMNPGYAGRQELPENLKIQFRTVAMMVPDRQIIMRVKLASCGFRDNLKLSAKFFTLYKLCEEQLSKQVHYDFGLRNILSCLRTLGAVKRAATGKFQEEDILMQVLRDMNLSKLVDEDEPLFLSLISDLFPGLKLRTASHKELQDAISEAVQNLSLINETAWNLKIVQLYETSLVRHGLMVLGPTGAGKTNCMNALYQSLTIMGLPHREIRMNPKAITAPQMFGRLDVTTNDWTDGIFSVLWRRTLKFKTDFVWLVLDGPVDAVWIENLNSVLDDNKTLTLANGDRILMSPNCKLVFEPDAIDNASPATVSRMGMVFMSSSVMPWNAILEGWLLKLTNDDAKSFRKFFNKIYGDVNLFVQTKLEAKMKILEAIYIRQICDILTGLLPEDSKLSDYHLERLFLFALMWSLGAALEFEDRDKMENFVLNHPSKMKWPKLEVGKWEHWNSQIEEFIYPSDSIPDYSSILVPNVDNIRTAFLIETIAKQHKSVMLIGEQGTAKTAIIKGFMSKYDPEYHLTKSFNFSSATTPNMFQRIIESYVEKRVGLTYGPPQHRRMTIFIDDINMPLVNEWGDQVTNEIVRQLMEYSGFYSLERPGDFCTIQDIQLLAAMIHPGGGRNDIPMRLKRQLCIFNCTLPSNKSMDKIFGVIGNGYFCGTRFNKKIVEFVSLLIPLTRKVWQQTKIQMLPTPAKFHYIFNLRDLSRIWGGMLKIEREQCQDVKSILKLWQHECTRTIADRFTNVDDREWFKKTMTKIVKSEIPEYYEDYPKDEVYFVDFLRDAPDVDPDHLEEDADDSSGQYYLYEEIPSFEEVRQKILNFMETYNVEVRGGKLNLVFFQDALIHLMIISRIIRTQRGNALLVGVGGSGKQSLTRLASFIAGYRIHQITITRSYNITNFADEFKYLYRVAGLEGQGISFIFTDNDIKDESFLEYLNNVLSSGEIANLFAKDEIDEITSELIPIMKKVDPKRIPTQDNLYDFFISRARSNLHVVLCFSPVGEKFRNRSLKFPGLISGCVIDWFQKWPMDALVEVSHFFLADYNIECSPSVKEELIKMMAYVQDNVSDVCVDYFERFRRQTFVTPKSFLSFLEGYKKIYTENLVTIVDQSQKMTNGLEKLREAAESIDILKVQFQVKVNEITKAEVSAQKVIETVEVTRETAEEAKKEVAVKQIAQAALVEKIITAQKITEKELEKTMPQLLMAEAALKTVKSQDIATVRRLGKPPHLITVIMDVVMVLFCKRLDSIKIDPEKYFLQTSWEQAVKMMADTNFLKKIIEFKRDTIDAECIDLMEPYFNFPNYSEEAAKLACGNVAGLLKWTKAMAEFYLVNKDVLPLKAELAVKQAQSEKATEELQKLEESLAMKEKELESAEEELETANKGLQNVKNEAALLQSKLDAAHAMITGLVDERERWTHQIEQFSDEIGALVGDVLILTGFLSYTGPFNQEFRASMQLNWQRELGSRRIPYTTGLDVVTRLADTSMIGEWNLQGLPNDELSIQNGIIVTQGPRYPLLIDPQAQGKFWIKQKDKENGLIVTSLVNKYFRNHLEDAVSQGLPLLIEDVGEELDPCLDNILEKNYVKMGNSYKVKIGDKEVDTHPDFRLYVTTKLPNPMYTPEITARTMIIDFTVTIKGLEDQLLGRVILSERNDIETERMQLETDVTMNKKLSKELENNLLYKLSTTQGSLLDDLSVMEVLNTSKAKAIEIREKLESAEVAKVMINQAREQFRSVATRGSVLYFSIVKMTLVNNMYQTSLVQFLERFDYSLRNSVKTPMTIKRIKNITEFLTYDIFKYKSRGLYETDKLLFVLLIALDIDLERGFITFEEFQNFIKGGAALDINTCPPKSGKWISDSTWLNIVQLSNLAQFKKIINQIKTNEKEWKQWYDKAAPEEEEFPSGYDRLDDFRKLLIIRSFCIDRALSQCTKYISLSLGARFADPVLLNYESMLEESQVYTPIVCFLSMGSDPTPSIESLAKKNQMKVDAISMGQGQEVHARKLIKESLDKGYWVLLQNCHLGLEYMDEVTLQLLELKLSGEGYNENFRLWITTEVHPKFPVSMLQMSVKYTNEPPSGVRAGLKRTYSSMSDDMLDHSDSKFYMPLIYSISFFHTIVQERRKFGALGWNIPYEFNTSDWLASCYFIQNHLDYLQTNQSISWKTVNYMIGEVQYGGRVTDNFDKRLLNCFAKAYFSDEMFKDTFAYYSEKDKFSYKIVVQKTAEDYLDYFDTMPSTDPPNVYGLHPNADITYQTNKTNQILDTIISVQPKESSGSGGETRESVVTRQVEEMLTRIPQPYDEFEVKKSLTKDITPMNIFLRQEIDRIQSIILLVKSTLSDLLLAIEGTIIMNDQCRDAFDNIYDARVPKVWLRGSWAASTLGFWFTELIQRNIQFSTWCFKGRPNAFWMTGMRLYECPVYKKINRTDLNYITTLYLPTAKPPDHWILRGVALLCDVK
ncbi:CLUMA_CG000977, isoform A [Clunio marinus]|uniref:CLUMA_CG000977, isoform A n=1 Tax=Clunio marinus TaxID=568069 RepID=A0A1J1HLR1_9DIPT|nr:CLUMA_CG000977, isoform A [Clunio marinus]